MKKIVFLLVTACCSACFAPTKIVNSWRDPSVTVDTSSIKKFMVAALLKNELVRRRTEDKMASLYPGKAVQSYVELGLSELKETEDFYSRKFKDEGYDGVVVMRLVKVSNENIYVPGAYPPYYGSWRMYYGYAYPSYYDPGYYAIDKTYYVEVNVYSLKRDKLIWTGITSTINPSGGDALFDEVIKTINRKMKEQGFIR